MKNIVTIHMLPRFLAMIVSALIVSHVVAAENESSPGTVDELIITVNSATISPTNHKDSPWDDEKFPLGSNSPDAYLKITTSKGTVKTPPQMNSFHPQWKKTVRHVYSSVRPLKIQIWEQDSHNNEFIGKIELTGPEDFTPGTHETGSFNRVQNLQYKIRAPQFPLKKWKYDETLTKEENRANKLEYIRKRKIMKACYLNQKELTRAINAYNMDYSPPIRELTPKELYKLVEKDVIMEVPDDPDEGENSSSNYFLNKEREVECIIHGRIRPKRKEHNH